MIFWKGAENFPGLVFLEFVCFHSLQNRPLIIKHLRKFLSGIVTSKDVAQVGALVSFFASCRPPAIALGLNDRESLSGTAVGPGAGAETPCCTVVNGELHRRALAYKQWTPKQQNYRIRMAIAPNVHRKHRRPSDHISASILYKIRQHESHWLPSSRLTIQAQCYKVLQVAKCTEMALTWPDLVQIGRFKVRWLPWGAYIHDKTKWIRFYIALHYNNNTEDIGIQKRLYVIPESVFHTMASLCSIILET